MLLVVDGCEQVIDAAATLAEAISKAAARMNILVTSREALRVEGERVQRLAPLKVPFNSSGLSAADALTFPAVQLFVEPASPRTHLNSPIPRHQSSPTSA